MREGWKGGGSWGVKRPNLLEKFVNLDFFIVQYLEQNGRVEILKLIKFRVNVTLNYSSSCTDSFDEFEIKIQKKIDSPTKIPDSNSTMKYETTFEIKKIEFFLHKNSYFRQF